MFSVYFIFLNHSSEEWEVQKQCDECTSLENENLNHLKGTIVINEDQSLVFTDYKSKNQYNLCFCDANCDNRLIKWLRGIGMNDSENNTPLLFLIEGKLNEDKNKIDLLNITLAQ